MLPDEEGGSESQAGFADEISKVWDEMEAGDAPADTEDKSGDDRPRDDKGRFVAKEGDEESAASADEGEGSGEQEAEGEPASVVEDSAVAAPEHWSQEEKDRFNALPPEGKVAFLDFRKSIESGYNKKFEELATERKTFEPLKEFDQIFAPYDQAIAMRGMTRSQYVRQILAVGEALQRDPRGTLQQLAKMHNVDLGNPAGAEMDEDADPTVVALNQVRQEMRQELQSYFQQFQQQTTHQTFESEWNGFQNAKDTNGHSLYPSADKLKTAIGVYLSVNPQQSGESVRDALNRAYEQVKWSDPDTRKSILEAEKKAADAERQRKADLDKAKKSGDKVAQGKTSPGSDTRAPADTWKDELERNWDQANA